MSFSGIASVVVLLACGTYCWLSFSGAHPSAAGAAGAAGAASQAGSESSLMGGDVAAAHRSVARRLRDEGLVAEAEWHDRIAEALKGGRPADVEAKRVRSDKGPGGFETVLDYQQLGEQKYFDAAGMPGRVYGLKP